MHYFSLSSWIFAALMLLVILLFLYPAAWLVGISMIILPVLIFAQIFIVLRANNGKSQENSQESDWYEHK
ncbi:MAG: hypothetical protein HUU34_02165 [Saprospiraceae bacterium]|jgi:uncharacterized membrane protein YkvI|nr:hypothetical protein [Saprospiraceae bacterium]